MNILILDQFADLGGAQLCLADLVPAMLTHGWSVHAAAPDGRLLAKLRQQGTLVHPLAIGDYSHGRKGVLDVIKFGARLPGLIRRVRQLAAELRPGVIYVNGPRLMPAVAMAGLSCTTVFHSHNRIAGEAERLLVKAAIAASGASVIAASEYAAAQWSAARVVYSGVDGPTDALSRTHADFCIGMIGRISPQKRQKEFVLACARLAASRPDLRFMLCGDVLFGDRRGHRYQRELQPLFPHSLRVMNWTDRVDDALAELDLLVVPSSGEGGFPRVALEAFAAGVPVLAHASGAIPEVIVEGRNGFLLRYGSPEEIASRIHALVEDRVALQRVAVTARRLWMERFTTEHYRRQVCELLRRAPELPH